jgi:hypothetical protein
MITMIFVIYLRTPYFSVIWTDVELSLVTDKPLIIGIDQER